MDNHTKLYSSIAGATIMTGLSLATYGSSGIVLGVLNGIAGNLAAAYIEKTEYKKIKKLINNAKPDELNHDLQKLIIKASTWASKNIEILYKENLSNKHQVKELERFTKRLKNEFELLKYILDEDDESIVKIVKKRNNTEVFEKLHLSNIQLPIINPIKPYNQFFKDHFEKHFKLCFSELLKKNENRPAYIAYQKAVYDNLTESIEKVIEQNNLILAKLDVKQSKSLSQENQEWRNIKEYSTTLDFNQQKQLFDDSLKETNEKLNEELKADILEIKKITGAFLYELKSNWFEKNRIYTYSIIATFIIICCVLGYKIYTTPFTSTFKIQVAKNIQVHPEYPELTENAHLSFSLPNGTVKREINTSEDISLNNLKSKFYNKKIGVRLDDKYWKLTTDSTKLSDKAQVLFIKPNDFMSEIRGVVYARNINKTILKDAVVKVGNLQTKTDINGEFILKIPFSERKIFHSIRISKEGYLTSNFEYISNDFQAEFPLMPFEK